MQHVVRLDSSATQQCVHLIVTATVHHDKAVRQVACSMAASCVKQALSLSGDFIAALQQLLRIAPDIPASYSACGSSQCMLHMRTLPAQGSAGLHIHKAICLLCLWLMPCTAVQAAAPSGAPAEEEGVSPIALSNRLQTSLHSIAPPPQSGATPLGPEAAARYLLAAHHPKTTMARARSDSVWCAIHTTVLLAWNVFKV